LLFTAFNDQGDTVDQETCGKFFLCLGSVAASDSPLPHVQGRLDAESQRHAAATISRSTETNNRIFQTEREKLDHWAEDMVLAVEKELSDTKVQIRAVSRQARQAATVQEQHELQLKVKSLETAKRRLRERIFQVEDEIDRKRDALIEALERQMAQRTSTDTLFTIRWSVE
jgi:predicted  nucleic acid-binding Zn-ribbon protein